MKNLKLIVIDTDPFRKGARSGGIIGPEEDVIYIQISADMDRAEFMVYLKEIESRLETKGLMVYRQTEEFDIELRKFRKALGKGEKK